MSVEGYTNLQWMLKQIKPRGEDGYDSNKQSGGSQRKRNKRPHWAACQFEVEEKPSESRPIKSMLYLSCTRKFNESRGKLALRKITQNGFLWLFTPSLSNQLSPIRCRGSIIRFCRVASTAAKLVCTAHHKTSRTGCRCKQPSCFHFCGHVPSSQGRPQCSDHKHTCKLTFAEGPQWK